MGNNVYDDFRSVQGTKKLCYDRRSAAFIDTGRLSQIITHKRLNEDIKAAIVFNHKEGPDEVLVYTFIKDDLIKSDYFIYDDVNYLVYENMKMTDKDIDYKKQKALECNVNFEFDGSTYDGYFMSSMRRNLDSDFEGRALITPDENPLLVLPTNSSLEVGSKINIENKP